MPKSRTLEQRFPSQPAMRSACEVSACSVLTDIDVPRGGEPIQPSTARLGHQTRCVCASLAWLEARHDRFPAFPRPLKWVLRGGLCGSTRAESSNCRKPESLVEGWYHSVARFPICDTASETEGQDRSDRQNAEIASETRKSRRGNLVGIRIEIRLAQKSLKVDGKLGRIVNSMQMEMILSKAPWPR